MEPIDAAYERFKSFIQEYGAQLNNTITEADTRMKVIDRILTEVLLWPHPEIRLEEPTDTGYADYVCRIKGKARLVVEAKKDGRVLGCEGRPAGAHYKLNGPVFREKTAQEGIAQAISYCGSKNAELACVTNGREWIIFRGNRLGDGTDTNDGMALIFPSLADIDAKFQLFYDLLNYDSVANYNYRPYFHEAEGQPIRTSIFSKPLRTPGSARFLTGSELAADIDKMMALFFQRLSGEEDPDLIRDCFVETTESRHADTRLARIAEEIVTHLKPLDSGHGNALRELITRVQETKRREFVLVVGTKGSGKSTFIQRFFDQVLPRYIAEKCVVVRVDLRASTGDTQRLAQWLDSQLLNETERTLFPEGPGFNDLQGMFFDDYTRLKKGSWAATYERDKEGFKEKFGDRVEAMRTTSPHDYIKGLIRHVISSRKSLPVVVFDNADHFDIDFQQRVYQYARSIYEVSACLVVVPITDRTSWQLSKHGALQSFEHEALFLPTPPTGEVIRKRVQYIEARVEAEKLKPEHNYFVHRGVNLSLDDIQGFTRSLQRVFLETVDVSRMIGDLANHDVRRTLTLIRQSVGSPHLAVSDLVTAYISGTTEQIPRWKIHRALVRQHHDIYPVGQHDFVQNVFALDAGLTTTPLLGVRLLQLLSDVPVREHEGPTIDVDQIAAYCTGMGIEPRAASLWLNVMLQTGLVLNYDPTVESVETATSIEISPSGKQHLKWALDTHEYLGAMADVTPLLSEETWTEIRDARANGWRAKTATFLRYVMREDDMYCTIPEHATYESQRRISAQMEATARRLTTSVRHRQ
jgi:energy-coupling factor transporter ATP-binding protein EcfA2